MANCYHEMVETCSFEFYVEFQCVGCHVLLVQEVRHWVCEWLYTVVNYRGQSSLSHKENLHLTQDRNVQEATPCSMG